MRRTHLLIATLAMAASPSMANAQEAVSAAAPALDMEGPMVVTTAQQRGGQVAGEDHFTGTAYVQPVFDANEPFAVNAGKVTFLPGAHSNWHSHPAGQMLVVTEGTGWVATRDGQRIEMHAGDVVWTPPGVEHWHGATSDSAVTHYAIQQFEGDENVIWLEPVSSEDYLGH